MTEDERIRFELHAHTDASDGLDTARELLDKAREAGIEYLAITDHDTVEGYLAAERHLISDAAGLRGAEDAPANTMARPLQLIPGIEISSQYEGRDVHMLGYYFDPTHEPLLDKLEQARLRRTERSAHMAEALRHDGYPVSVELLDERGMTINRTNIARLLIQGGVVDSIDQAFATLLGDDAKYYVDREDISSIEAIELIISAGGLPVIAHPHLYRVDDLIEPLAEHGLRGVEAYHIEHSAFDAARLAHEAQRSGLLVTGGSDWHGDQLHGASLGASLLPQRYLEEFLAADPRA